MLLDEATGTLDGIGQRDHSDTSEYRILGPPGTGKTTSTAGLVERAAAAYGPSALLVTSFSRAAAAELANCELPIPPNRLGTLHSICYHALGRPAIAEAHVQDWNRSHPACAITSVSRQCQSRLDGEDALEETITSPKGDSLLQSLNYYRGTLTNPELWPAHVREFERAWTTYKRRSRLLDFCDLIDQALKDIVVAPGRPAVIFADEAQDLNLMQARLIRKWGQAAQYFVLAGDDDQVIYSFLGAAPEALLEPAIPADHLVVLRRSHRVPRAVHHFASTLIQNVTRRQAKVYLPRELPGTVQTLSTGSYKSPDYFILSSAMKHIEQGKSIMFLASCSYMLQPLIQVLRKNGIPFHNPYRKANGFWNPLHVGPRTATRRIISLLVAHPTYGDERRPWTYGDLLLWTEWFFEGTLKPGTGELLARADRQRVVSQDNLTAIFEERALASLLSALKDHWRVLLDWWCTRIRPEFRTRVQFPADIASKYGPQGFSEDPNVVVGTIHSVKGGQSDVVYVFPDLSRAGNAQYQTPGRQRDSVIRLFYVGATRARETLYICRRETAAAICL